MFVLFVHEALTEKERLFARKFNFSLHQPIIVKWSIVWETLMFIHMTDWMPILKNTSRNGKRALMLTDYSILL